MNSMNRRLLTVCVATSLALLPACSVDAGSVPQEENTGQSREATGGTLTDQIAQVYVDTLGRTAQAWEINAWVNNIETSGWTIASMRTAFTNSDQCKAAIVKVYQDTLERTPLDWEINAWRTNLAGTWSIASMRNDFAHSDEARGKIVSIYLSTLQRPPSDAEVAAWQANLAGTWSLATMRTELSNPLPYHGGPIALGAHLYFIYYGHWTTAQSDIVTQFFSVDLPKTPWMKILTQDFTDGSGRHPAAVSLNGITFDSGYSVGRSLDWPTLDKEVGNMIAAHRLPSDPNGIYMVLESSDLAPANAAVCGMHRLGPTSNRLIGFAFNPGCTVDSECGPGVTCHAGACSNGVDRTGGCLAVNTTSSPNGDVGVDTMLSNIAHEVAETVTDPRAGSGWIDTLTNSETGDICAYYYGQDTYSVGGAEANLAVNGRNYMIQTLYSPRLKACTMTP
jgi:hypothetical protein